MHSLLIRTHFLAHSVNFLLGEDQNPWVWVMGDHPDDKSVDELLEEEVRAKARQKAEKEAAIIRYVYILMRQLSDSDDGQVERTSVKKIMSMFNIICIMCDA